MEWFYGLSPVVQAIIATLFTWGITAIGSSMVFFFKNVQKRVLNSMLGFAAGVMIAASFWSLINPALEMAESINQNSWLVVSLGFMTGGLFLLLTDKFLPHLHVGFDRNESEGLKTSWQRSVLLVLAITLHNIPEGLAVGIAFGGVAAGIPSATVTGAMALAIGIGIQNFPEGAAVSLPLRREGYSPLKSFLYGQASGIVEPIAGVIGAAAVIYIERILPFALAFAAGAMIFVVVEELIPEAQHDGETDITTIATMLGFVVMMILDVALG